MNTRALFLSTLLLSGLVSGMAIPAYALDLSAGNAAFGVVTSANDVIGETLGSKDGPIVLANTGEGAQSMITRLGDQAMAAIADESLDAAKKKQLFRTMLSSNFDMKTIGKFAMGKFWRETSPAQQAEYLKLYENMIINVYTARFENYEGQKFKVLDNRLDDSGDVIVNSTITGGGAPVNVAWRVRPKNGSYKIIDVMVEGVSMAVTQRNDFAGVIQKGGNNVDALLTYLRQGGTSDVDN